MTNEQKYYVSLEDKKISDHPIQGEATLEIMGKPEDIKQVEEFMHKNNDEHVGERYEEDLKTLFQLVFKLGTKETKKTLIKMLK